MWNGERRGPPPAENTVLGVESSARPYMHLWLRRSTGLLTPIVSEKIGVDVTEGQKWGR